MISMTTLFWLGLAAIVTGSLLIIKFLMIDPIKRSRIEKKLESLYACPPEKIKKVCEEIGIEFGDSDKFRRLLKLRPELTGNAYGVLLKAQGVAISSGPDVCSCRHDPRVIFLAEELNRIGHCPVATRLVEGMSVNYPAYAQGLRLAWSNIEKERRIGHPRQKKP